MASRNRFSCTQATEGLRLFKGVWASKARLAAGHGVHAVTVQGDGANHGRFAPCLPGWRRCIQDLALVHGAKHGPRVVSLTCVELDFIHALARDFRAC